MKKRRNLVLAFLLIVSFAVTEAKADLIINAANYPWSVTPPNSSDTNYELKWWAGTGTANKNANDIAAIIGYVGPPAFSELYKQNTGTPLPSDTGAFAPSYITAYNGDMSGGTISWVSGQPAINWGQHVYLFVKDGNQTPAWYLFDITALGWDANGQETIIMQNFWPSNGSISHVALYAPVPIPAAAWLLGSGLLGLVAIRRRFKK